MTKVYSMDITAKVRPLLRFDLENEQDMPEIAKKINTTIGWPTARRELVQYHKKKEQSFAPKSELDIIPVPYQTGPN